MPNPRRTLSFEGIDIDTASFFVDGVTITYSATATNGSAQVGLAVTFSADNTVALTQDGNAVVGKLLSVDADGVALVQVGGFMTLPGGNGATLTRGSAIVGALGAASARGYIRSAASATAAELIVCRGFIAANGTPTATQVYL